MLFSKLNDTSIFALNGVKFSKWFMADEDKLEKVLENSQVIKMPVVRNGKQSTIAINVNIIKI